ARGELRRTLIGGRRREQGVETRSLTFGRRAFVDDVEINTLRADEGKMHSIAWRKNHLSGNLKRRAVRITLGVFPPRDRISERPHGFGRRRFGCRRGVRRRFGQLRSWRQRGGRS